MKPHPRAWRCRLFPEEGSRLYVRVLVFARRKDLVRYWEICGSPLFGRAQCRDVRVTEGKHAHRSPAIAEMTFWAKELGADVITHECTHAAFSWAQRRRLSLAKIDEMRFAAIDAVLLRDHPEERIATVAGDLAEQFVRRARASGLYE